MVVSIYTPALQNNVLILVYTNLCRRQKDLGGKTDNSILLTGNVRHFYSMRQSLNVDIIDILLIIQVGGGVVV